MSPLQRVLVANNNTSSGSSCLPAAATCSSNPLSGSVIPPSAHVLVSNMPAADYNSNKKQKSPSSVSVVLACCSDAKQAVDIPVAVSGKSSGKGSTASEKQLQLRVLSLSHSSANQSSSSSPSLTATASLSSSYPSSLPVGIALLSNSPQPQHAVQSAFKPSPSPSAVATSSFSSSSSKRNNSHGNLLPTTVAHNHHPTSAGTDERGRERGERDGTLSAHGPLAFHTADSNTTVSGSSNDGSGGRTNADPVVDRPVQAISNAYTTSSTTNSGPGGIVDVVVDPPHSSSNYYAEDMSELGEEPEVGVASLTGSDEEGDDVVHCTCGSTVDEGFMIQVGTAELMITAGQSPVNIPTKITNFQSYFSSINFSKMFKLSEKNKTCRVHAHAQSSINPLTHLARSYLCARVYGAEKRIQTSKYKYFTNILIGYRDDW